jgi:hypothetical protein
MSMESREFRSKAAAEFRASRRKRANETGELLRTRAKAFKALAENEERLSGEKARLMNDPTTLHQTG